MSISVGLNIAVRALLSQQRAVDTVSHNIANATTPGYSRQRVRMAAVPGYGSLSGSGYGVEAYPAERVRNGFLDYQVRDGLHSRGNYEARAQSLSQAELALGEPGESGLRAVLGHFFNAWRDLANEPESGAARSAVVQAGGTFAAGARRIHDSLVTLRQQADEEVRAIVAEVNSISERIGDLNQQIVVQRAQGDNAPDLSDERDRLLDRLATVMDVRYQEDEHGSVSVFIGGSTLVSGDRSRQLVATPDITNSNFVDVQFADNGADVLIGDGQLRGLLDQRDLDLPDRIGRLNTLVGQIVADVNAAHGAGFAMDGTTGRDFFSGVDASDVAVDAPLLGDPNLVAAASVAAGPPGDGSNASVISDLEYARGLLGGTATYDEYYAGFVADLGVATREFESLLQSQELVLGQLDQMRQSASGINLDEEMIGMMEHQRAYEAAARMVNIFDEMLDTIVNGMR